MGFIVKDTGGNGDFTPVPQGTHLAICNMVADLGLQETTFNGETKTKQQCYIRWELINERIEYTNSEGARIEGPMNIGKTYTASLSEKANLRHDLEAWRGRAFTPEELDGFDTFNVLGVPCQVTVTHKTKDGKTYANVTSVAGWPKGMTKPGSAENKLLKYCADETQHFGELPKWIQEKILTQKEPNAEAGDPGPQPSSNNLNDEIPF